MLTQVDSEGSRTAPALLPADSPVASHTWVAPEHGVKLAIWWPTVDLMTKPIQLKHAPSTALLISRGGHFWVASMLDHAWTEDLVSKATCFLGQRVDTWSWQRLGIGLAEHLALPVALHNLGLLLDSASLIHDTRLADAIFRRWLSSQRVLPAAEVLYQLKAELVKQISSCAESAFAKWHSQIDPELGELLAPIGVPLDVYNYLVATPLLRLARRQFTRDFPLLCNFVSKADARSVWRDLRGVIDRQESPQRFLSNKLGISLSAVRSLRGVTSADAGLYFAAHPDELLEILNAFPPEHRPTTPSQWTVLGEQFHVAKTLFCGRSPAGKVLVKTRLTHVMRSLIGLKRLVPQINADDISKIEQLRSGMVLTVFSHSSAEENCVLGMQRRALIAKNIDQFLGRLSWSRLMEISNRWQRCYGIAVALHQQAIGFIAGQHYFDYIPDGKLFATNGLVVQNLLNVEELQTQGSKLMICLATSEYRQQFHEGCWRGDTAVFSVMNQGVASSTAAFHLRLVGSTVALTLLQHTGRQNEAPRAADMLALVALMNAFSTETWQAHAKKGLRIGVQRAITVKESGLSPEMLIASLEGFKATFKGRADDLMKEFSCGLN